MVACYDASGQRREMLGQWRGAINAGRSLNIGEQATALRSLRRGAQVAEAASIFPRCRICC
jgi:hypothetical protein